jgi:hypothetical protein
MNRGLKLETLNGKSNSKASPALARSMFILRRVVTLTGHRLPDRSFKMTARITHFAFFCHKKCNLFLVAARRPVDGAFFWLPATPFNSQTRL